MKNAFIVHPKDAVAVVTKPIAKGDDVTYIFEEKEVTIKAIDNIPTYHKIAIKSLKKGDNVLKYGEVIGHATADIEVGNHVHTQNLSDIAER